MTDEQRLWARTRDRLVDEIERLGQPRALGEQVAKQLGGTRAMERMIAYLSYVKPQSAELIVDEMLAICSDIETWRNKKMAEEANARYNDILYYGLGTEDDEGVDDPDDSDTGSRTAHYTEDL